MVKYVVKMDSCGKIYIAKALRESGLNNTLEIHPNSNIAVIYRAGAKLNDVLESIRVIVMDLEHQLRKTNRAHKGG